MVIHSIRRIEDLSSQDEILENLTVDSSIENEEAQ